MKRTEAYSKLTFKTFYSTWEAPGSDNISALFFPVKVSELSLHVLELWAIKKHEKKNPLQSHLVKKFWVLYSCDDPVWNHTLGKLPLEFIIGCQQSLGLWSLSLSTNDNLEYSCSLHTLIRKSGTHQLPKTHQNTYILSSAVIIVNDAHISCCCVHDLIGLGWQRPLVAQRQLSAFFLKFPY